MALILGMATSCASHLPESLELAPTEQPSADVEPLVYQPQASEQPSEPEPTLECLPDRFDPHPPAIPTYAAEPSTGACRAIAKPTREQLRTDLKADWYYQYDGSRLAVDFGCDRLGDIEEITAQYGGGHGGTLDLVRLRASADGSGWEVLLLRNSAGYYSMPDERGAGVYRGHVGARDVERVLDWSRAAMVLEAEEITDVEQLGSASFSSGDFHAFVRLVDAHGSARAVGFTGYPSSERQLDWRIPELATWKLAELVEAAQLETASPDADSREFFMQRFAETEAASYHDELGAWWVHGRLVQMAGTQATLDLLPALGLDLCPARETDVAASALEALTAIVTLLGRDDLIAVDVDELGRLAPEEAARWRTACAIDCP